ncbi:uncharacterized protein N7503_001430 [Penicillium pulvis]|uniref:uncharacterized protein n=1 Tax=Penicillium pulvis TaxID=1562058 RepID=UPI002548CB6D|nr:uncharacterized protein N7503_001430 [Penicillium pulvis]KAJ5809212.1 hypothetical protein N7503_001430 [Penicillium pulvis]
MLVLADVRDSPVVASISYFQSNVRYDVGGRMFVSKIRSSRLKSRSAQELDASIARRSSTNNTRCSTSLLKSDE